MTDKAIIDYEMAIQLSEDGPAAALAHRNLGEIYMFVGPEELAVEDVQEALRTGEDAQLRSDVKGFLKVLGDAPR